MGTTDKKVCEMGATEKLVRRIINLVLIVLLVYNISALISAFIYPNLTPTVCGIKLYIVMSGSMEPTYNVGDIVLVSIDNLDELKVGDVISFKEGEKVVTHRISKVENDDQIVKYITKGDANNTEDLNPVLPDKIEGKVIGKIPFLGKILLHVDSKIIIMICILLLFLCLNTNSKKMKNKKSV